MHVRVPVHAPGSVQKRACAPCLQDALAEVGQRLDTLEGDREALVSTTVRAADLKELENYLLERLGMQVREARDGEGEGGTNRGGAGSMLPAARRQTSSVQLGRKGGLRMSEGGVGCSDWLMGRRLWRDDGASTLVLCPQVSTICVVAWC